MFSRCLELPFPLNADGGGNPISWKRLGRHEPLGTKLLHTVCFVLGNYFRQLLQETLQHDILGGINYCNVMIGAVLL